MSKACDCEGCPAYGELCEGCSSECTYRDCAGDCVECDVRCARRSDRDAWLETIGGLALDVPLTPQPRFDLPPFFPQLLNQVELSSMIARETAIGVGIAKVLTPGGRVSRRAFPFPYSTYSLRAQWGIAENSVLVCAGTYLDDYLEKLWAARSRGEDLWGRVRALGFDAATSLNLSIYFDQPRLEHLINLKRSWLTVRHMQESGTLIPIPHLQWCQPIDLARQLQYAQTQGFHTLALNLQMVKRRAWDPIEAGLLAIRQQAPELRPLFLGVVALKRMDRLAALFPTASFTNTAVHYLAGRHIRLVRAPGHRTRLIKEPVDGHPDIVLAENVRLYREFVTDATGASESSTIQPTAHPLYAQQQGASAALQAQAGLNLEHAVLVADELAVDAKVLSACQTWLHTGHLDRGFRGSFPTWPCADLLPAAPTLGQLLDRGLAPLDAFLHLAGLAEQVDEEIQAFVGQAGY